MAHAHINGSLRVQGGLWVHISTKSKRLGGLFRASDMSGSITAQQSMISTIVTFNPDQTGLQASVQASKSWGLDLMKAAPGFSHPDLPVNISFKVRNPTMALQYPPPVSSQPSASVTLQHVQAWETAMKNQNLHAGRVLQRLVKNPDAWVTVSERSCCHLGVTDVQICTRLLQNVGAESEGSALAECSCDIARPLTIAARRPTGSLASAASTTNCRASPCRPPRERAAGFGRPGVRPAQNPRSMRSRVSTIQPACPIRTCKQQSTPLRVFAEFSETG